MVVVTRSRNGWFVWFTLLLGLLLSVAPMPEFMEVGRPLWIGLLVAYWSLAAPQRIGMTRLWLLGVILVGTWKFFPFVVIAMLGILQSIPSDRYEAAKCDGAGWWQEFRYITVPAILPVIMLLSQFLPWLLTPILMIGGAYLAYEGVEKVWEALSGHQEAEPVAAVDAKQEESIVSGAIATDFILSAEIMVIALNEVADEPFVSRLLILIVVALLITALVYGVVAVIVKMDDIGLRLSQRSSSGAQAIGRGLVRAMPVLLRFLSTVGIAAMLWVGGHIILGGIDELGWHGPYDLVHHLEEAVGGVAGIGGLLAWVVNTVASALVGLVVGAIIVAVMHLIPRRRGATAH